MLCIRHLFPYLLVRPLIATTHQGIKDRTKKLLTLIVVTPR